MLSYIYLWHIYIYIYLCVCGGHRDPTTCQIAQKSLRNIVAGLVKVVQHVLLHDRELTATHC
jgi:hypothetical protein